LSHWLEKVVLLLQAETSSLRELARLVGRDPRTFYSGVRFEALDLTPEDRIAFGFGVEAAQSVRAAADESQEDTDTAEWENENWSASPLDYFDEAWIADWLKKWPTLSRDPESRRHLADEGEQWLKRENALGDYWPIIFDFIWVSEKKNSNRRTRLYDLAMSRILHVRENRPNWLKVWRRLWKHESGGLLFPSKDRLLMFFSETVGWFEKSYSPQDPQWPTIWRSLWLAGKLAKPFRDSLIASGIDWLSGPNLNETHWGAIWRDLWDANRDELKTKLLGMGRRWLKDVDERHQSWAAVWRRVWVNDLLLHGHATSDLVGLAEWWLDRNPGHPAWPTVWRRAAKTIMENHREDDWMVSITLSWLKNTTHYEWPSVWLGLMELSETPDKNSIVRTELLDLGVRWLEMRPSSRRRMLDQWALIWLTMWKTPGGDQYMRNKLLQLAETRKFKNDNERWREIAQCVKENAQYITLDHEASS
jgi:hypothetical protein